MLLAREIFFGEVPELRPWTEKRESRRAAVCPAIEAVTMPVKPGHHIVQINVSGVSADDKQISAADSFAVDVAAQGEKVRDVNAIPKHTAGPNPSDTA